MIGMVDPHEAKRRLHSGGEIAFLDVREAGQFGEGHPLLAVPCPYSRLELTVVDLVPRRDVAVLLIDAGDGVAERAVRRLAGLGYTDVSLVNGGAPGWAAAGLTLYQGVNVPSKTLGELAEALWHPQSIDAATLREWRARDEAFRFFDARPPAEFSKMHVPGAVCLPNGELAHRFAAAVNDPATPVLISCAGRTRGIVGAIGLKLAGVTNPVFALENGTQGWALAGEQLVRGDQASPYPSPGEAELEENRRRAENLCRRFDIPRIAGETLGDMQADWSRTTYLFDVRSADEFAAGHIPGAVNAPGGQLVQASDQWIGVRHARVVLADDTGLRAALAAFWLKQMGWEPYVLTGDAAPAPPPFTGEGDHAQHGGGGSHTRGPGLSSPGTGETESARSAEPGLRRAGAALAAQAGEGRLPQTRMLPAAAPNEVAAALTRDGLLLLDLRHSQAHRDVHPLGAQWAIRPILGRPPTLPSPASSTHSYTRLSSTSPGTGEAESARHARSRVRVAGAGLGADDPHQVAHASRPLPSRERSDPYRTALSTMAEGSPPPTVILLADEPTVAELAAIDLRELGYSDIRLLEGGVAAWQAAGLLVEATPDRPSRVEAIDFLHFVHDRHDGNLESSRRYLAWEQGLVAQLDPAERAEFRLEHPAA